MLPLSASASSALLAPLTFLSWPSGPHPWLRLLTTSPTELQIGWHTMPQILKHQHNALTDHTPSLSFSLSPHPPPSILSFSSPSLLSFSSMHFFKLSKSVSPALPVSSWQLSGDWCSTRRNHLPPCFTARHHEQKEPELTKLLPSETKVVCSIIQTGATPTAASATLTLTNGQKNRWFVHS